MRRGAVWTNGELLLHPLSLLSLGTWILNDHVLKEACPGALTGKLSDVASLFLTPLMVAATVDYVGTRRLRERRATLVVASIAIAGLFAAIQISAEASRIYEWTWGVMQWPFRAIHAAATDHPPPNLHPARNTMDPTDLVALPFALGAFWLRERRASRSIGRGMAALFLCCAITPRTAHAEPHPSSEYRHRLLVSGHAAMVRTSDGIMSVVPGLPGARHGFADYAAGGARLAYAYRTDGRLELSVHATTAVGRRLAASHALSKDLLLFDWNLGGAGRRGPHDGTETRVG